MLQGRSLDQRLWPAALETATLLRNWTPTKAVPNPHVPATLLQGAEAAGDARLWQCVLDAGGRWREGQVRIQVRRAPVHRLRTLGHLPPVGREEGARPPLAQLGVERAGKGDQEDGRSGSGSTGAAHPLA
ncbi:hypothetical protein V8E36_003285 [Tilletia maclaganii]